MTDRDPQIAALLDRLVPPPTNVRDEWETVAVAGESSLSRSCRRRRVRLLVALCLIAVGVLVPVIALATGGWWFQRPSFVPNPVFPVNSTPSIIATGTQRGERWAAVGYLAKRPGQDRNGLPRLAAEVVVCVSVIVGSLSNQPQGTVCSAMHGMALPRLNRDSGDWLTFLRTRTSDPAVIVGAVARGVASLKIVLLKPNGVTPGGTINVPLTRVDSVGHGVRFFALAYPTAGINSIKAFDTSGKLLQRT